MISRQPDISIITINFNGFKDTCELIESLETNIKSVSYEIIVVDNASLKNEYILLKENILILPSYTVKVIKAFPEEITWESGKQTEDISYY